jgi:hypothetical protein
MSRAGIVLLAACGGAGTPPIANHASSSWNADLAVFDSGTYRLYSLAGDKVTEIGKVVFANNPGDSALAMTRRGFGWADRDHLIVSFGDDVKLVTAGGVAPLAVPAEASLVSPPKPKPDLESGGILGLTVHDGEAWWSKCAWGFAADGFQCETYVYARIWPSDLRKTGTSPIEPRPETPWPKTASKDFHTKENEGGQSLSCQPPGGAATELKGKNEDDHVTDGDAHWVSLSPPRLLVQYWEFGLYPFPADWGLYDGCKAEPLERGSTLHPGPDGLWVAGGDKVTIRRGATVLGELPSDEVKFRPAR